MDEVFGPNADGLFDTKTKGNFTPLILAIAGGAFMGLYPSFIKSKKVLAANVHPVVFQLYKSSMVFITGWFFLIPRIMKHHQGKIELDEIYVFNKWAVISAMFWVPSGLLTITSVPMIGMGMQVAISCAANSILSFMVFWLVFGTTMKSYPIHGNFTCPINATLHPESTEKCFFKAPIYLVATVVGMVALVFAQKIAVKLGIEKEKGSAYDDPASAPLMSINQDAAGGAKKKKTGFFVFMMGLFLSIMCGVFAAVQFGVITVGKSHVLKANGCTKKQKVCPAHANANGPAGFVTEAFDNHGSWLVSFGIGALGFTLFLYCIASVYNIARGMPRPGFHWDVMHFAGVGAGSCWALANFLQLAAVVAGGNAIIMAQTLSAQIIASGLFAIFFYGEGGGKGAKIVWFVAALWTLFAMVMLGLEKGKSGAAASGGSNTTFVGYNEL